LTTPCQVLRRIERAIVLYHSDLAGAPAEALIDRFSTCGFDTAVSRDSQHRGWIIVTRRQH
jgi:hypothetical protein